MNISNEYGAWLLRGLGASNTHTLSTLPAVIAAIVGAALDVPAMVYIGCVVALFNIGLAFLYGVKMHKDLASKLGADR